MSGSRPMWPQKGKWGPLPITSPVLPPAASFLVTRRGWWRALRTDLRPLWRGRPRKEVTRILAVVGTLCCFVKSVPLCSPHLMRWVKKCSTFPQGEPDALLSQQRNTGSPRLPPATSRDSTLRVSPAREAPLSLGVPSLCCGLVVSLWLVLAPA